MAAQELFESIVAAHAGESSITTSKMFGSPGLKVDGKVFAMLVKGKLVVKLPQARVEALLASGDGAPFDPGHGRISKAWVAIEPRLEQAWPGLVVEARDFVAAGR